MGGIFQVSTGAAQQEIFQQHGRLAQSDLNSLALDGSNFTTSNILGGTGQQQNIEQALETLQGGHGIDVKGPDGQQHTVTSLAQLQQLTQQDRNAHGGGFFGGFAPHWPHFGGGYMPFQPFCEAA